MQNVALYGLITACLIGIGYVVYTDPTAFADGLRMYFHVNG
jgi:hypothetical protein